MSNTPTGPTAESLKVTPLATWTEADASAFRTFLDRSKTFLPYLASQVPVIKTGSMKEAALTGATHRGYEELFRILGSMVAPQDREQKSPYITEEAE